MTGTKVLRTFSIAADTAFTALPIDSALTGTFTSLGKKVVGSSSDVDNEIEVGSFIYFPTTGEVRRVIRKQGEEQFFLNLPLNSNVSGVAARIIDGSQISEINFTVSGANARYISAEQASLLTVGGATIATTSTPLATSMNVTTERQDSLSPIIIITGATTTIVGHYIR